MSKTNDLLIEKEEDIGAALQAMLLLCEEVYKCSFDDVIKAYQEL